MSPATYPPEWGPFLPRSAAAAAGAGGTTAAAEGEKEDGNSSPLRAYLQGAQEGGHPATPAYVASSAHVQELIEGVHQHIHHLILPHQQEAVERVERLAKARDHLARLNATTTALAQEYAG